MLAEPGAFDPVALSLLRVPIVEEPAAVVPGAMFGLVAPEGLVPIVPGAVIVPRSPDWAGPDVELELVAPELIPLVEPADPLVAPLDEPVDPLVAPLDEPELADPVPDEPALPPLLPDCACARPNTATATAVASEVTSLFDMMYSYER